MPPIQYRSPQRRLARNAEVRPIRLVSGLASGNGRYKRTSKKNQRKFERELREEADLYTELIQKKNFKNAAINTICCNNNTMDIGDDSELMAEFGGFGDVSEWESENEDLDYEDNAFKTLPPSAVPGVVKQYAGLNNPSETKHTVAAKCKLV